MFKNYVAIIVTQYIMFTYFVESFSFMFLFIYISLKCSQFLKLMFTFILFGLVQKYIRLIVYLYFQYSIRSVFYTTKKLIASS